MIPIHEIVKTLAAFGAPAVPEGDTIPRGLSYKGLPDGSLRLNWMEPHQRLVITVDSEGRIERADIFRPDRYQVTVNGEPRVVSSIDVGGPDIAALAGMRWIPGLSITWSTKDRQAFGSLGGDRKVAVQDGMIFNCYNTGNA